MGSPARPWTQQRALIRRFCIKMRLRPILNLLILVIIPSIAIGLAIGAFESSHSIEQPVLKISLLTLLATILNVYATAFSLVTDKATGMKSLMISMGLSRVNYYCAMSIPFILFTLPIALSIAMISKLYLLDATVSYLTIMSLFTLFTFQLDAVLAAGISFITSTNLVILPVSFIALVDNLLGILFVTIRLADSPWEPVVLFFASSSPYAVIKYFFSSYAREHNEPDPDRILLAQPLYLLLTAQIFWTIVLRLFACWLEDVCPWQKYTASRGLFFCLKCHRANDDDGDEERASLEFASSLGSKYFEQRSNERADIGIKVRNVSKSFGGQVAVDDVSFTVYKGETTLLLGHNGAGKSTLMKIILSLIEPNNGYVKITNRLKSVAPAVGVCPQTSILDDDLCVGEHLELFNDIKSNIFGDKRAHHIHQTIEDVSLLGQESKQPQELSGGMKRKLSLAMAFVGESNVLILDEPSSGLDPESRMLVWNAIRRYRSERTVLLSTQHMEEADYLGDRIAIMSAGRIVCCGSSIYLNKLFGTGYKLRLECSLSGRAKLIEHIQKHYFEAVESIDHDGGANTQAPNHSDPIVDYVLELKTNNKKKDPELELVKLLEDLENYAESLSVRSYGLKSSSIEDVMLNTGKYFASVNLERKPASLRNEQLATITGTRSKCIVSLFDILSALIIKHLLVHRATMSSVIAQKILLPIISIYFLTGNLSKSGIDGFWQHPEAVLIVAHLVYFPSKDYTSKFKIIQLTSHATVWIYWLAQALADLIWLIIPMIALNLFVWNWPYASISDSWQLHCLTSMALFCFYLASMLFSYCLTFVVKPRFALVTVYIIAVCSMISSFLVHFTVALIFNTNSSWSLTILAYTGILLVPTDAFAYILVGLRSECHVMLGSGKDCEAMPGLFSPIVVGFAALCIQIALYATILALIETQLINFDWYCRLENIFHASMRTKVFHVEAYEIDPDVVSETAEAMAAIQDVNNPHALVAAELSKSYTESNKIINNLSFTVNKGECFGLLGVNGAGKTTTFAMLATDTRPDSGRILANGHYSGDNLHEYRKELGYDPQATPAMSLTPHQALSLMARLRGVDRLSLPQLVGAVLDLLDMSEHAHKPDGELSGGTKRKLALGMALIGNPAILALDEPTAGIDPLARRSVWELLKSLRACNASSIVISSHAMEECEAICNRIAIMARGRLRCIGTFLHLRSKFAKGCTLRVQATTEAMVDELQQQLVALIGGDVFTLADKNVNSVTFDITDNGVKRSILFRMMREFHQRNPTVGYMINDKSLDDIFFTHAREQENLEITV